MAPAPPSPAVPRAFTDTCRDIKIIDGVLHADCHDLKNVKQKSSYDLNKVIGIVDGKLTWGASGFSKGVSDIQFDEATGLLSAIVNTGKGKGARSTIDLKQFLVNENGILNAYNIPVLKGYKAEYFESSETVITEEYKKVSYSSSSSIIESCTGHKLNGAILEVTCLVPNGPGKFASINLDEYIGVVCGELKWDSKHFSAECLSYRLEVTSSSILLIAEIRYGYDQVTGKRVIRTSTIDLTLKIRNNNGTLVYIAYDEKLSLMLSEVPWMKFRVVAEPDFSAIATNAVMQSTMSAIAQSTVQHVVAEMSTKLTFAIEEAMKAVMISAEKHIAVSMQQMLVGVSTSAHIEQSRTELSYLHLSNGHLVPTISPTLPPPKYDVKIQ